MATQPDIIKTSKSPDTNIVKMGHTTNGAFGSDPAKKVKGGRQVRNLSVPNAKG